MNFSKTKHFLLIITTFACMYISCHPNINSREQVENNTHLRWSQEPLNLCTSEFRSPPQASKQCSSWVHDRTYTIRSLFKDSSIEKHTSEFLALQLEELYICRAFIQTNCLESFDANVGDWLTHLSTTLLFDYIPHCTEELVAIDVGHSPKRYGATSSQGKKEYDYNLTLALKVQEELRRRHISAVVLNYNVDSGSFAQRKRTLQETGATLFMSIHHDSVQPHYLSEWSFEGTQQRYSDKFSGFSLFVSAKSSTFDQNKGLANSIGSHLAKVSHATHHHAEAIRGENRTLLYPQTGVYQFDNLGILRGNTIPSVLIEAGVLVNRNEELRLSDSLYQLFLASNIASGINQYCHMSSTDSF